jgi:SRSO17 transposase
MDVSDFDRVRQAFAAFHAAFAPVFGRKQWRERSQDYLQALLVQTEERCNAENLSEVVAASARVLQRFLTEACWDDQAVLAHLQAYLAARLNHPEAVWVVDESGFPKQGKKSVGVKRQYCGAVGKVANCQMGVFLAHVGPRGRVLVDKRLYLPEEWTNDPARCEQAGVPNDERVENPRAKEARVHQSKPQLALLLLKRAVSLGYLRAAWVTGDDEYGRSPDFRSGVAALGLLYVLEVPHIQPVWSLDGRECSEVGERAAALPEEAWQPITVAQGEQGARTYLFASERVRESCEGKPGKVTWLIHRKNLDAREARYYFSNAPEQTPLWVLAQVGAARWPIETEFETGKSHVGMDEYEVRSWSGWNHPITMCFLASAFLLSMQQEWGKKDAPYHPSAGLPGGVRPLAAQALDPRRVALVVAGHATAQGASQAISRQTSRGKGGSPLDRKSEIPNS